MPVESIFANNKLRNYQYIVFGERTLCIDPYEASQILMMGRKIDILVNTHQHGDHIRGNQGILDANLKCELDKESILIDLGNGVSVERIKTPGHTMDSVSFLLKIQDEVKAIFLGDTIFQGGVGNCYNGGDPKVLAQTILDLNKTLSNETILYMGHDYRENNKAFASENFEESDLNELQKEDGIHPTWIQEKSSNVFLRVLLDSEFREKYFPEKAPIEAFCELRKRRDQF